MNHLQLLSLSIGIFAVGFGWWCLQAPEASKRVITRIPRNVMLGRVLMLIDSVWSIYLLDKMEISMLTLHPGGGRGISLMVILALLVKHWPLGGILVYLFIITYVDHYLAARSIGLFLILAAKPVLWICFMRDEPARLVIVVFAYLWIIWGMCIVSAPHWLRDVIEYCKKTPGRWIFAARAKILFGLALIGLGLIAY